MRPATFLISLWLGLSAGVSANVIRRQDNPTVIAVPSSTPKPEPCAAVASLVAESFRAAPPDTTAIAIYPSLALACLKSVPVDVERDTSLIDYLLPYVQFHSTLGYLLDPPTGYLIPGFDVVGGLEEIKSKLFRGGYSNQWEFAWDLQRIFVGASDGHFYYQPSLLDISRLKSHARLSRFPPTGSGCRRFTMSTTSYVRSTAP